MSCVSLTRSSHVVFGLIEKAESFFNNPQGEKIKVLSPAGRKFSGVYVPQDEINKVYGPQDEKFQGILCS